MSEFKDALGVLVQRFEKVRATNGLTVADVAQQTALSKDQLETFRMHDGRLNNGRTLMAIEEWVNWAEAH